MSVKGDSGPARVPPVRGERVSAIVEATMPSDARSDMASTTGLSNWPIGVFMPKRNSSAGSAKYRTKALSPGIADSGSKRLCAAA